MLGFIDVRDPIGHYNIRVTDNDKPVVEAGPDKSAIVGGMVKFDGSGSSDNVGITSFAWDFGDGSPQVTGMTVSHVYTSAGIYIVTLTVNDAAGNGPVTDTLTVSVSNLPAPPVITSVTPNSGKRAQNLNVTITGTGFIGTTAVSFGQGITVNSFEVVSSTQITANIRISTRAKTGSRNVSITSPAGKSIGRRKFTVVK